MEHYTIPNVEFLQSNFIIFSLKIATLNVTRKEKYCY